MKISIYCVLMTFVILSIACSNENVLNTEPGIEQTENIEYRVTGSTVYFSFEPSSDSKSALLRTGDELISLGESVEAEGVTLIKFRVLKIQERGKTPLDPEVGMEGYILESSVKNEMKPLK